MPIDGQPYMMKQELFEAKETVNSSVAGKVTGLGGYVGLIGALGLGEDHVAPGLNPRRTKKIGESYFHSKGVSLSSEAAYNDIDLNDFRANMYKETLSPNTYRQKAKLNKHIEAIKSLSDASSRHEYLITSLDPVQ